MSGRCKRCGALPFGPLPEACPFCRERDESKCSDCGGRSVTFRGRGKETQWRLCPKWRSDGHMSEAEWRGLTQSMLLAQLPSGRQS